MSEIYRDTPSPPHTQQIDELFMHIVPSNLTRLESKRAEYNVRVPQSYHHRDVHSNPSALFSRDFRDYLKLLTADFVIGQFEQQIATVSHRRVAAHLGRTTGFSFAAFHGLKPEIADTGEPWLHPEFFVTQFPGLCRDIETAAANYAACEAFLVVKRHAEVTVPKPRVFLTDI